MELKTRVYDAISCMVACIYSVMLINAFKKKCYASVLHIYNFAFYFRD